MLLNWWFESLTPSLKLSKHWTRIACYRWAHCRLFRHKQGNNGSLTSSAFQTLIVLSWDEEYISPSPPHLIHVTDLVWLDSVRSKWPRTTSHILIVASCKKKKLGRVKCQHTMRNYRNRYLGNVSTVDYCVTNLWWASEKPTVWITEKKDFIFFI